MTTIARFDDLPSELILCIFDFLSPADRYKSFFDYDLRVRVLVKKRTEFSRKELDADIRRFSTLHSWYKHLSFKNDGNLYFIVPRKGQQPRYSFDTRVTDANGLHWWFVYGADTNYILNERVRTIVTRYPFRLNPFFYHLEYKSYDQSSSNRSFDGGDLILQCNKSTIETWLKTNYPECVDKILKPREDVWNENQQSLVPVFDGEWLKATAAIQKVAVQIWNELKELDDINPLQNKLRIIKYLMTVAMNIVVVFHAFAATFSSKWNMCRFLDGTKGRTIRKTTISSRMTLILMLEMYLNNRINF